MCKKLLLIFLFLSLSCFFLSAQDMSADELKIAENQEQIISIVLSLKESANIREDIFKLDMQNFQDEKADFLIEKLALQKEKNDLAQQKVFYEQTEKDMQKLKDSLEKLEASYEKEQKIGKLKNKIMMILAIISAGSTAIALAK